MGNLTVGNLALTSSFPFPRTLKQAVHLGLQIQMYPPEFLDPPTRDSLVTARRSLDATHLDMRVLSDKIDAAEASLAKIVRESRLAIEEMLREKRALDGRARHTLAYLSPMRRLPLELLREIFLWSFQSHPCSAWVLASVCSSWRRLALRIPVIWSKIRLLTTQQSSADTIRLWIERSGDSVPLDIEIFLRVARPKLPSLDLSSSKSLRRTNAASLTSLAPPAWNQVYTSHHPPSHFYLHSTAGNVTVVMPQSPSGPHFEPWGSERPINVVPRASLHWGHIAFFYLVEQMHRWQRFVFRFDKQFPSIGALKSITGDAPLLREFEVSSVEAGFFAEWPWLPNASSVMAPVALPNLRTLTLQHTPFKWSSPMLRNLHSLNLRALPTSHLPLDRILAIIANNTQLHTLALHFQGVLPAVLPLVPLALPHLKTLCLGGHYHLTTLLENLVLPTLTTLTLDIEARDPIEDAISSLLVRSNRPPLQHLAIAYSTSLLHPSAAVAAAAFYYGPGGMVITWSQLLAELPELKSLRVGGTALEPLLGALSPPDDDPLTGLNPGPLHAPQPNSTIILGVGSGAGAVGGSSASGQAWTWACPKLEALGLRSCLAHSEGVNKLVQMVEARNPPSNSNNNNNTNGAGSSFIGMTLTPLRLRRLEMHDCTNLGEDVMKWLETRITEVICTDPIVERAHCGHPYL